MRTHKLNDKVLGFIYEYYREDNNEIVYIGSSDHIDDKWGKPLDKVDRWHRIGETFNTKYKYNFSCFRSQLRHAFGKKVKIRLKEEAKEMSYKQLLELEGKFIKEAQKNGQCYLNHTNDPLKSHIKFDNK